MISWWCFCFALTEKCKGMKLLPQISSSSRPPCEVGNTGWCLVCYVLLNSGASMLKSLFWPSQDFLFILSNSVIYYQLRRVQLHVNKLKLGIFWEGAACVNVETPLELCKGGYSHHRLACLWCVKWDEVSCVSGRQPCLHLFNSSVKFTEHRGTSVDHAVSTL